MPLQLTPNFFDSGKRYYRDFSPGDDFYECLIAAHRAQVNHSDYRLDGPYVAHLVFLRALGVLGSSIGFAKLDQMMLRPVSSESDPE